MGGDNKLQGDSQSQTYKGTLTRRESLKWLSVLSASTMLPVLGGCDDSANVLITNKQVIKGHWPELDLPTINIKGYGKDPNLLIPPKFSWPLILTSEQITLVAALSDILIPRDGKVPSASEVNVPDVINEWVSAPYEQQQNDRLSIISMLVWLNDEAIIRFRQKFMKISFAQQLEIIDDIAFKKSELVNEFYQISKVFSRFRKLVLAAFFCTPEGTKDIGYKGNVAIAGDYPGPSDEAQIHLNKTLKELNLSL